MKRISFRGLIASVVLATAALVAPVASNAASLIYDSFFTDVFAGNIVVNTDTFKCQLVTSSYTANKGTHDKRDDITNEVTGTGYTAGGTTCTVSGAVDTTNHRYDVTITGPSWTTSTITARAMVISKSRGGAASADNLVAYIDFTSDVSSTAATFAVTVTSPLRITN